MEPSSNTCLPCIASLLKLMDSRLEEISKVSSVLEHEKENKKHAQTKPLHIYWNSEEIISVTNTFTYLKNTTYN